MMGYYWIDAKEYTMDCWLFATAMMILSAALQMTN